jgi:hypothetical protein
MDVECEFSCALCHFLCASAVGFSACALLVITIFPTPVHDVVPDDRKLSDPIDFR